MQPLPFLDYLVSQYDPHGSAHATDVAELAGRLAVAVDLNSREIQQIEVSAHLHDIGKIIIPESIRRLPGIYTPFERHAMQNHTEKGAELMQLLDFDPEIIASVLSHHENFDGSGYPSKLSGEAIPIGARIIRIVDSFDALTHSRGYRPACSQKKALEKIEEVHQYYDPQLLDLFSEMIKTSWTTQPWSH